MLMKIGQKPDSEFDEPITILEDYHKRILHLMKALSRLAESASSTPLNSSDRSSLEGSLRYFREAAPRHNADEEQWLFPLIRRHADAHRGETFERLASFANDHRWANELHCEVDAIGSRWLAAGTLRPNDRARLRSLVHSLSHFYVQHIATEEGDLFSVARQLLSNAEFERLGNEMAERHSAIQMFSSKPIRQGILAASAC